MICPGRGETEGWGVPLSICDRLNQNITTLFFSLITNTPQLLLALIWTGHQFPCHVPCFIHAKLGGCPRKESPAQDRGQVGLQPPGVHPPASHPTPRRAAIFTKCKAGACFCFHCSIATSHDKGDLFWLQYPGTPVKRAGPLRARYRAKQELLKVTSSPVNLPSGKEPVRIP